MNKSVKDDEKWYGIKSKELRADKKIMCGEDGKKVDSQVNDNR